MRKTKSSYYYTLFVGFNRGINKGKALFPFSLFKAVSYIVWTLGRFNGKLMLRSIQLYLIDSFFLIFIRHQRQVFTTWHKVDSATRVAPHNSPDHPLEGAEHSGEKWSIVGSVTSGS